ncbi:MAG TPA: hypothetical protein V6D26_31045 [Stenomitos sp.]
MGKTTSQLPIIDERLMDVLRLDTQHFRSHLAILQGARYRRRNFSTLRL